MLRSLYLWIYFFSFEIKEFYLFNMKFLTIDRLLRHEKILERSFWVFVYQKNIFEVKTQLHIYKDKNSLSRNNFTTLQNLTLFSWKLINKSYVVIFFQKLVCYGDCFSTVHVCNKANKILYKSTQISKDYSYYTALTALWHFNVRSLGGLDFNASTRPQCPTMDLKRKFETKTKACHCTI